MNILTIVCRVLLGLLCVLPALGSFGLLPPPTAEMYSPSGWAFMEALMSTGYMMYLMGIAFAAALLCMIFNRTALGALILLPITVNIVAFHAFIDRGMFAADAILAWILLALNAYFLWLNWKKYEVLWK